MKKLLYCLSLLFSFLTILFGTDSVMAKTQVINIGTSGQTKPLNYVENGKLTGLEIDMLNEVDRRLPHLSFQYGLTEFSSLFAGLDAGDYDILVNNLGESPERKEKYLFSKRPYLITHNVLITADPKAADLTINDLAGQDIAVVPASPQALYLENWNKENLNEQIDIKYVESDPTTLIRGVATGQFAATIYNTTYLTDVENTYGLSLKASPIENEEAIRPPGSYLLFRPEQKALRDDIDQVLADMEKDGSLQAIREQYLSKRSHTSKQKASATDDQSVEKKEATQAQWINFSLIPKIFLQLLKRLPMTLFIAIVAAVIGLLLGLLLALIQVYQIPVLRPLARLYISFMRGTPKLVQLFLAYYGIPILMQAMNQWWQLNLAYKQVSAVYVVLLAFALNEAAYASEIFRSAIHGVNYQEIEAARSLGLTEFQILRRIILPNAIVQAIPNIGNSLLMLLKGTSLAFSVTIVDIMGEARILAGANLRYFEAYMAVALLYWLLCLVIEAALKSLEHKFDIEGRHL